jgi:ribosomal protein S27AE
LAYNTIHACQSGCVLFRRELANEKNCPKCGKPRYKDQVRKKFPVKVLRYFPIISRVQRMFRSPAISELLLWHKENRGDREGGDNLVKYPCDSKAWRHFHENVDPTFGIDARNIHFAPAADGLNPFKQTRSTWTTWLVILLNYNLPPWLCTKKFFVMLALLIVGKESVTSEVFDVYIKPLVEELLQLWYGIPAYDITKEWGQRCFTLHAVMMWTIHDFPGCATVGGFFHQGYAACPQCGPTLSAEHSQELGKQTYGGTRRWLP